MPRLSIGCSTGGGSSWVVRTQTTVELCSLFKLRMQKKSGVCSGKTPGPRMAFWFRRTSLSGLSFSTHVGEQNEQFDGMVIFKFFA
jgi:hypothetical protein